MDLSFLAVPRVYGLRTLLLSSMAQERSLRPVLPMEEGGQIAKEFDGIRGPVPSR
jgi:hypothetical protein